MWKAIAAGAAVASVVAGSTFVYAQQRPGHDRGDGYDRRPFAREHVRPSMNDLRAFADARIAGLKAGLQLTADQEKNWPAFEQAAREFGKLRLDRFAERKDRHASNPVERMRQRAEDMSSTAASLKKLVDATDPLYNSLDDAQKRRFAMLGGNFEGRQGMQRRPWRDHMDRDRNRRGGDGPDGLRQPTNL